MPKGVVICLACAVLTGLSENGGAETRPSPLPGRAGIDSKEDLMSNQKLIMDLDDLVVESIEVAPANSLDSATYGHGMHELDASCGVLVTSCAGGFMSEESDEI